MKGIKKHLVALLSTVLMMTSLGIAPALADDAPLGNDDFNIVVNKKLNPKDLTLDLKIKLEDKDPTTPKVVNDLSQVFKDEGKEKEKLDLVKDKTDEYEMVVSENGEVEFELNYSKEVKAAEGEAEAINRDEKHSFKVNVTEIEEAKAEEPKVEEPKVEEPKVEESKVEDVIDSQKPSTPDALGDADVDLEVVGYNPTVEWKAGEQYQINVKIDFKDNFSTDKEIRISIPEGMSVVSYPVKGAPVSGTPEYSMTGTLVDGVITDSQKLSKSYYDSFSGEIVYKITDTTQIVEFEKMITLKVDESLYYGPKIFTDAIKVQAYKNGDIAGEKSFSHTTVENISYVARTPIDNIKSVVSQGDTDTMIMANPRITHAGRFNQVPLSVKNITATMFYPQGTIIDDSKIDKNIISKDDSSGKIVLSADNVQQVTGQLFTVPIKYGHLAAGNYNASQQSYFEVTFYDGTKTQFTDNAIPKAKMTIIDPTLIPNKLDLYAVSSNFSNQHEDFSNGLVRYGIKNDNTSVKTNQTIELEFDSNLEIKGVLSPGTPILISKVLYSTNKDTSLKELPKSQVKPMNKLWCRRN
ncbi:hypothetical protein PT129_00155 [Erysipelothrix rhusiopathiae]|nr:hypothetical protein [Erysipelothrix rhusiopathiae]